MMASQTWSLEGAPPLLPRGHEIREEGGNQILVSPRIKALLELGLPLSQLMGGGKVRDLFPADSELPLLEGEIDHWIVIDSLTAYTYEGNSVPIVSLRPASPGGFKWRYFPSFCSDLWILVPLGYSDSGDPRQETFRRCSDPRTLYLVEPGLEMVADLTEIPSPLSESDYEAFPITECLHGPKVLVRKDWEPEQVATALFRHLHGTTFVTSHEVLPTSE